MKKTDWHAENLTRTGKTNDRTEPTFPNERIPRRLGREPTQTGKQIGDCTCPTQAPGAGKPPAQKTTSAVQNGTIRLHCWCEQTDHAHAEGPETDPWQQPNSQANDVGAATRDMNETLVTDARNSANPKNRPTHGRRHPHSAWRPLVLCMRDQNQLTRA